MATHDGNTGSPFFLFIWSGENKFGGMEYYVYFCTLKNGLMPVE